MPHWKQLPFARCLPPFLTGILIQWHFPQPVHGWSRFLLITTIGLFVYTSLSPHQQFRLRSTSTVFIACILAVLGALAVAKKQREVPFAQQDWPAATYALQLLDHWKEGPKTYRNRVKIVRSGYTIQAWLYIPKDSTLRQLPTESWLMAYVDPRPIPEHTRGGFDFQSYSLHRGITHQVYARPNNLTLLQKGKGSLLDRIRHRILDILRSHIPGKKEAGLAEALLIGYKEDLDPELETIYAQTGVVHIIAISGMHLGLIYGLLILLFRLIKKHPVGRWIRVLLIATALWVFSLLAGSSPSVLRSAVMFSGLLLGEALDRKSVTLNTLAFTALVLLLYQPYWLGDIGFQLSFAAVWSILVFYPPLYRRFYFRYKVVDWFWQLVSVTLAAQVLTFPLCVYHFHQFPTWFLAANLVAVPLSNFILLGEIGLCLLSEWSSGADMIGQILSQAIQWMNQWVGMVNQWPYAIWAPLSLTVTQTILIYGLWIIPFLSCTLAQKIRLLLLGLLLILGENAITVLRNRKTTPTTHPPHIKIPAVRSHEVWAVPFSAAFPHVARCGTQMTPQ